MYISVDGELPDFVGSFPVEIEIIVEVRYSIGKQIVLDEIWERLRHAYLKARFVIDTSELDCVTGGVDETKWRSDKHRSRSDRDQNLRNHYFKSYNLPTHSNL